MYVLFLLFRRRSSVDPICAGNGKSQARNLFDILDKRGKYGLVHNIGLGGAVVVTLLRRPEFYKAGGEDGRTRYAICFHNHYVLIRDRTTVRLGYNHGSECRPVTREDIDKVKSKKWSPYVLDRVMPKL